MTTVQAKKPRKGACGSADSAVSTAVDRCADSGIDSEIGKGTARGLDGVVTTLQGEDSAILSPAAHWYVYLVRCVDGSLYCGITTHMQRRLAQHNGELAGGAKCTRARRPVVLEGCIACADRATASRYERQIKKKPREQKLSTLLSLAL